MTDKVSIKKFAKSDTSSKIIKFACLFLSEFFGTFMLLFFGCSTLSQGGFVVGLNFGLTVLMCVQIWGVVSGAHINPAVTLGALIFGVMHWAYAIVYAVAQILGGMVGYATLRCLCKSKVGEILPPCVTAYHSTQNLWKGLLMEFCLTGALVLALCVIWDKRNEAVQETVPLRVGFTVGSGVIAGFSYTGGSLNPARSLAPAVYHNMWQDHWIYWVGPLLGAVCAALFYRIIFERQENSKDSDVVDEVNF